MTERIYTICLVVSDAKAFLTDLPYATVDVCPKAVATGHTLVEVEQIRRVGLIKILVEYRLQYTGYLHFYVGVISSELASLGSLVAYDAIMVVFLFQIEYVNRIHSCKTEYHHCNIMSKLRQGLGAIGR